MDQDLKSQHFSAVFTAIAPDESAFASSTKRVCGLIQGNGYVIAFLTALLSVLIILCLRPPFILRFDVDKRRPWQATTEISWLAVGAIGFTVGITAALLPRWISTC